MTEPKTKAEGVLSVGAKTYIREQAAQDIFGVDFIVTGKPMEKGIEMEDAAIELLNRVRGLSLSKNTERKSNEFITGEADLFDTATRIGHDIKCSWSIATFPIATVDCEDKTYEWQMRGYMMLWDAEEWHVDYCLLNTPDRLMGYEPIQLHIVDHIPEPMRVTSWMVRRDAAKEALISEKVKAARIYYDDVMAEFDRTHQESGPAPAQSRAPIVSLVPRATPADAATVGTLSAQDQFDALMAA